MNPTKKTARSAGLLYLIVVITGIINLAYLPSTLFVDGDAYATYNNVVQHELLYRIGFCCAIVCYTAFLFLPLVLYKLLHATNQPVAVAMVALAVVSVPVSLANLSNNLAILDIVVAGKNGGADYVAQAAEQLMYFLQQSSNGNSVASIFWGLWLLPFGYLVYQSQLIPKVLGILLMLGCAGYIIRFAGNFFFAGYPNSFLAQYVTLPGSHGEIGTCLWLLVMGVRQRKAT